MCGRFAMDESVDELIAEFVATTGRPPDAWTPDWRRGYNIKPTQTVATVIETVPEGAATPQRLLHGAHWSLLPHWAKEERLRYPTFNARSESAASKPTFSRSVASQRAVVPATGYYEWKSSGRTKTPFYIHGGEDLLDFAGLYTWWRPTPADTAILTVTILTREAQGSLAEIHERTPLTLPRHLRDQWLDPAVRGDQELVDEASAASREIPLDAHEVAPLAQNADGPELTAPVTRLL